MLRAVFDNKVHVWIHLVQNLVYLEDPWAFEKQVLFFESSAEAMYIILIQFVKHYEYIRILVNELMIEIF